MTWSAPWWALAGQRRTLPGFKVQAVGTGNAVVLATDVARFVEHFQRHAELLEALFRAADALEDQAAGCAAPNRPICVVTCASTQPWSDFGMCLSITS